MSEKSLCFFVFVFVNLVTLTTLALFGGSAVFGCLEKKKKNLMEICYLYL